MNRTELMIPILLYLVFIGVIIYLMRYQDDDMIATVIDFIIAVMSVVIMLMSYIRERITKKKNANAIWIFNGAYILLLTIGLIILLIAGVKIKNAGMIARGLSMASLIYTLTLGIIKNLSLYHSKNLEFEQKQEEKIRKKQSKSITQF